MASSVITQLPALVDYFPPSPEAYVLVLSLFQYFPIVTILQWLVPYMPSGKTSSASSPFNIPGRIGWSVMEAIGPIHLLYIVYSTPNYYLSTTLPTWNKVAAALYVIHYLNRAFINPLFVAPSISPIQADLVIFATIFNWMNSAGIGGWIVGYDTQWRIPGWLSGGQASQNEVVGGDGALKQAVPIQPGVIHAHNVFATARSFIPYLGIGLFALGMINNIRGERTLWRLRREEGDRRATKKNDGDDNYNSNNSSTSSSGKSNTGSYFPSSSSSPSSGKGSRYSKVYVIPPAVGLFKRTLYPHYAYEWLEWFGFVLVGTAVSPAPPVPVPVPVHIASSRPVAGLNLATPPITLAPWFVPFVKIATWLQVPVPLPALVFLVNAVCNMLPMARKGLRWYKQKFAPDAVAGRSAVIPGVPFL